MEIAVWGDIHTKKEIVGPTNKWVPPPLINNIFFQIFCVSLSLQLEEMKRVLNGEDSNSTRRM